MSCLQRFLPKVITQALLSFSAMLLLAAAPVSATAAAVPLTGLSPATNKEALLFRNGDLLYGILEAISPQSGIRWRHADVDDAIEFRAENIVAVHFPPRKRTGQTTLSTCRMQLSNGDELEGDVVVFDQEKAVLQTWYAGEITIPRKLIQSVAPVPPEGQLLFAGPAGLEGWTMGKVVSALGDAGEWRYHNGAFYATNAASIARDLQLPDTARVEFDLAWKGLFQLAFAIYTDYLQPINLANKDTEPEFAGFYSLQLNSFSANLLPVKKNDPLRYLGQVSVPAFNQKNTAHIEIRADKSKRLVSLLVDGNVIKHWTDTEDFAGQGRGVRLVHQGQGRIKLSNLRVSEWDGQTEEKPGFNPASKEDLTRLRNGDRVNGPVELVQDGKVTVALNGTKLVIPLNRVKQIELAGQGVEVIPREAGTVRAIFSRGGAVTFELEKWENGKVFGASRHFGALAFDAAAFSRVELQPSSAAGEPQ